MSRIAKKPIVIPTGVEINADEFCIKALGPKGELSTSIDNRVKIEITDNILMVSSKIESQIADSMSGTIRSLISNMIYGITNGFEKKLILIGVGYKASINGNKLILILGYSHPIEFTVPLGITIEVSNPTEILIKGADKQLVGQVAAKIRSFRCPEPYKGKGIRYDGEKVVQKEGKKK